MKNEDVIIDLVIALESSLLSGIGDKEGLSFRMSLRGAALLRSRRQPVPTFTMFKELYDARSAIVHNGATLDALFSTQNRSKSALRYWWDLDDGSESKRGVRGVIQDARQLTREVVREYLRRLPASADMARINADLDRSIKQALTTTDANSTAVPGEGG